MGDWRNKRKAPSPKLPPIKHGPMYRSPVTEASCAGCPVYGRCNTWAVPSELTSGFPDLMISSLMPSANSDASGKPHNGSGGRVLRRVLQFAGIDNVGFSYYSKCRLSEEGDDGVVRNLRKVPKSVETRCSPNWIREIWKVSGPHTQHVILGNLGEQLTGNPFHYIRNSWNTVTLTHPDTGEVRDWDMFVTWSPKQILAKTELTSFWVDDLRRAYMGRVKYAKPGHKILHTVKEIGEFLRGLNQYEHVSWDLETDNLSRVSNRVGTFHFSVKADFGWTIAMDHPETVWTPEERTQIVHLLRQYFERDCMEGKTTHWVGQNLGFDIGVLEGTYGWRLAPMKIYDTMVLAYILNETRGGKINMFYALKKLWQQPDGRWRAGGLVQEFLGIEHYSGTALKIKDGQTMATPLEQLSEYGVEDCAYALALAHQILSEFPSHLKEAYLNLNDHWFSRAIILASRLERNGMPVDVEHLRTLKNPKVSPIYKVLGIIKKALYSFKEVKKANDAVSESTSRSPTLFNLDRPWVFDLNKAGHQDELCKVYGLHDHDNLRRLQLDPKKSFKKNGTLSTNVTLLNAIENLNCPVCKESFNDTSLLENGFDKSVCHKCGGIGGQYPVLNLLQLYRSLNTLLGTYVKGISKHLAHADSADGWIRPSFSYLGTVTGRWSSSNPNAQNLPRGGNSYRDSIRDIYCAPLGYCIVACDLDQAEVGVAGLCSRDDGLGQVFRTKRSLTLEYRDNPSPELLKKKDLETDAHYQVASLSFNVPLSDFGAEEHQEDIWKVKYKKESFKAYQKWLKKDLRSPAKTITFSILYGKHVNTMAAEMKITIQEAQALVEAYFGKFKNLQKYLLVQKIVVERDKIIYTPSGRTRRQEELLALVNPKSTDHQTTSALERSRRLSNNTPIQAFANTIMTMAVCDMEDALYNANQNPDTAIDAKPIAMVHDDLWSVVKIEDLPKYLTLIQDVFYDVDLSPLENDKYPTLGKDVKETWPICVGFKVGVSLGKQIEVEPDGASVREITEEMKRQDAERCRNEVLG